MKDTLEIAFRTNKQHVKEETKLFQGKSTSVTHPLLTTRGISRAFDRQEIPRVGRFSSIEYLKVMTRPPPPLPLYGFPLSFPAAERSKHLSVDDFVGKDKVLENGAINIGWTRH